MTVTEEDLREVVSDIAEAMLGLRLTFVGEIELAPEPSVGATVELSGACSGTGLLRCEPKLARRLASILRGEDEEGLREEDVTDTVKELANMFVGNVKALVPQPTELSMPRPIGPDAPLPPRLASSPALRFECDGVHLDVAFADHTDPGSAKGPDE